MKQTLIQKLGTIRNRMEDDSVMDLLALRNRIRELVDALIEEIEDAERKPPVSL